MTWTFAILAGVTVGSAVAAVSLRNLVHCALCLVVTFAGLAGLYLQLGAEFVGFVQILVYIGAVAILIVFAILLTRGSDSPAPAPISTATPWAVSIAVAVFVMVAGAVTKSPAVVRPPPLLTVEWEGRLVPIPIREAPRAVPVKTLGGQLMNEYVVPLEVIGLLLTAAMIGAVIIALKETRRDQPSVGGDGEGRP